MSVETRRAHERFACEMAVWFKPRQGAGDFHLVEVTNISAGGILCLLHHQVTIGDELDIRIELPQRTDMVKVKGQVRHLKAGELEEWYAGIQFTEVQGMTVSAFMAYIEAMFI